MGAHPAPLPTLSVRELIDLLAHTEEQLRLIRRGTTTTDPGPDAVHHLIRQQNQVIAELRRRRNGRAPNPKPTAPN